MKKKREKKLLLGLLLLSFVGLIGCNNSSNLEVSAKDLAEKLKSEITYQDELSQIGKDEAIDMYQLNGISIEDCMVYVSTGITAEEIAVISVTNELDASKVEDAFERRVKEQKISFKDSVPEELKRLEEAVIEEEGNFVVLCISSDEDKAEMIIENAA